MTWKAVPGFGSGGAVKDLPPPDLPDGALSHAKNVHISDGMISRVSGTLSAGPDAPYEPHYLLPFRNPSSRVFLQAGLTKIYSNDFTTLTDITHVAGDYTGTADDRWTGGVLHGIAILNNGVQKPQYWAGTGVCADLTNWPATWVASSMRPFRNYLISIATTKGGTAYPYLIDWSSAADPGTLPTTWDAADPTKDAGNFPLSETAGAAIDGLALGDRFFIYKEDSIYEMQFIGDVNIFKFSKISDTFGVFARNCIANTPVGHVVLCAGDVILNTGQGEPQSIINNRNRAWLFRNLNTTNRKRCFVTANPKRKEVLICFPSPGAEICDMCLVWNWESNTWVERDTGGIRHAASGVVPPAAAVEWDQVTGTWDEQNYIWGQIDYGDTDPRLVYTGTPKLVIADQGSDFDGDSIPARIERTGLSFGDPDRVKLLRGIRPVVDADDGTVLTIRMAYQMNPHDSVTWGPAITYTVGVSDAAYGFASGRYLGFRIESTGNQPWRMRTASLDVIPQGQF